MKRLLILLLLPLSIHANAQTSYDKIQDIKITKTLSSDSMLLSKLAIQTIRGNAIVIKQIVDSLITVNLIIRSEKSGKRIIALEADSLAQGKKITTLQAQVKQLQTERTALTARVTSLEAKIIATDAKATVSYTRATNSEVKATTTETIATKNAKAITILQTQMKVVQKLPLIKGSGALRVTSLTPLNDSIFVFSVDTAKATNSGTLTPYFRKMISDLRTEVTSIKKGNTGIDLSVKEQSDFLQIIMPKKKKLSILIKQ